ncbi:MAG TPA: phosphoadenylyl-sulfate reductase [Actinobacteria bacterium]|nr:phosphoadenylyl-sulfate reductase [Actinomycetes bacterium]HEX21744.1 phosphoadenylyl-sulfate reductase [Actinomycetota bacterium]
MVYKELENASASEILTWAFDKFGDKIALASSFGLEDVALIDMMVKINKGPRVFTLDTGRLNQETYDVMDAVRDKYGINIEVFCPDTEALEAMVREKGLNFFYDSIENRKQCCGVRKIKPLKRALGELDAWITGLRRQQAVTRSAVKSVEFDESNQLVKINPLVEWSEEQVRDYVKENNVPYNKLHDQGFPSIGCEPCTRAVKAGEDVRAGRWWWETPEQKECGLHVKKGA